MRDQQNPPTLRRLFLQCFSISMFTFGGGSAIIALLQRQMVEKLKWISEADMLELITLAQATPGAVSVNFAVLIGYSLRGLPGALISALATVLPPLMVIVVITLFFEQLRSSPAVSHALVAVRASATALVMSVSVTLFLHLLKKKSLPLMAVCLVAFIAVVCFHVSAIYLIAAALGVGCIYAGFFSLRLRRGDRSP